MFQVFLESTLSLQKLKNFKNSIALFWRLNCGSSKSHATAASSRVSFGDLFASERSNREGYTEIFTAQLTTPSRVDLPVTKNTQKIFHNFDFECFGGLPWRLVGDSTQSQTTRVWKKVGQFLKTFSVFPRTFYDYSFSLSTETHPNTSCHSLQTPFLHLFTSKSSRKRYGFLFPHLISHVLSFIFVNICVGVLFFFRYGFVSFFLDCPCLDC